MSHPQRRRLGTFLVAILVTTPCLWAGETPARSRPIGLSAPAASVLESAAQALRAVVGYWIPWSSLADSARPRPRGRGAGGGLTPTCDAGASTDPSGRCGGRAAPVLRPTCDAGPSTDPNGCPGH